MEGIQMKFSMQFGSGSSTAGGEKKSLGIKGVIAVVLVAGLLLAEMIFLRGTTVAEGYVKIRDEKDSVSISVLQAGQTHMIEIAPSRKTAQLKLLITDPDGVVEYDKSELSGGKGTRYVRFRPQNTGEYKLYVNQSSLTIGGRPGRARVKVLVNDRRIITPLLGKSLIGCSTK